MPLEYRKEGGRLVWVRSPFTGAVTYFTDIHKKQSGFARRAVAPAAQPPDWHAAEAARLAELEAAQRDCPFCPGNEEQTTAEILRIRPETVAGAPPTRSPWLIRAFNNLFPRIPESCTGGRNESYVVVEDPRHFADGARHHDELLYTALLPLAQFQAVLHTDIAVARLALENPSVRAVLIRKNQGHESGASQPHVHNQVIGGDRIFPPVEQERLRVEHEPSLWRDILDFAAGEGFVIAERTEAVLYFCPFGVFPRSYDVVCPDVEGPIVAVAPAVIDAFATLLHQALALLGPLPLDYEIHDGPGVPLHAHVCARYYPYSNIGGTLNLPANLSATAPPGIR
jgi:galactose-1-phosphate uridylyltransferase